MPGIRCVITNQNNFCNEEIVFSVERKIPDQNLLGGDDTFYNCHIWLPEYGDFVPGRWRQSTNLRAQ